MAKHKLIVKRLASIEKFCSMNILCSDKTGTLTEGVIKLHAGLGMDENKSDKVQEYAFLNAYFQTGYKNAIDESILTHVDTNEWKKYDKIPYFAEIEPNQKERILLALRKGDMLSVF